MVDDYYLYIYVYLYIYLYIYKHLGVPRIGNYRISRRQIYENAFFFALPTDLLPSSAIAIQVAI